MRKFIILLGILVFIIAVMLDMFYYQRTFAVVEYGIYFIIGYFVRGVLDECKNIS